MHRYDAMDGTKWAVKHLTTAVSEAEVAPAAAFEDAAREHGIPVPAARRTPAGTVLANLHGDTFRVTTWAELAPADIRLDPTAVGALLAALHTVPVGGANAGGAAVHPWYVEPVGERTWEDLLSRATAAQAPFAASLGSIRHELVTLEQRLCAPAELRTCHRDLFADNLRATLDGGLCVIDFDNCGPADPSQELAFVLVEFATDSSGTAVPSRAAELLGAYAAAGGPGRVTTAGSFSMAVAVLGHLVELGVRRWLGSTDQAIRAEGTSMVAELLERPLTGQVVDELLAVSRRRRARG